MKIVHVYAKNLEVFADAVKDTDCRLNASQDINYLLSSLQNYNARDVLGLVLFANPITKKCLRLIKKFDNMFALHPLPVIIVTDNAKEMYNMGYFRTKHSQVFLVESEDNSVSDVEISAIFTTLLAFSDDMYDLSVCAPENKANLHNSSGEVAEPVMSEQLTALLQTVKGSELFEDRRKRTAICKGAETAEGEERESNALSFSPWETEET